MRRLAVIAGLLLATGCARTDLDSDPRTSI